MDSSFYYAKILDRLISPEERAKLENIDQRISNSPVEDMVSLSEALEKIGFEIGSAEYNTSASRSRGMISDGTLCYGRAIKNGRTIYVVNVEELRVALKEWVPKSGWKKYKSQ